LCGGELGCCAAEKAVMVERKDLNTAVYCKSVSYESNRG